MLLCDILSQASPWRGRLLLLAALLLAGCQAVNTDGQNAIGSITTETATSRIGQIFTQAINRYIRLYPQVESRYRLATSFDTTSDETSTSMTLDYVLYDKQLAEETMAGNITATASFGGVASLYAIETSRQFAHERLAMQLADRLYFRLLTFFSRR